MFCGYLLNRLWLREKKNKKKINYNCELSIENKH